MRETFEFKYDPRPETDDEEKNRWLELVDIISSNPNILPTIQQSGYDFNMGEALKKVISASGASGWDKVLTKLKPEGQPGQPGQPSQGGQEEQGELEQTMSMYGIDENTAQAVVEARRQGFKEEEILDYLRGDYGQR